MEDPAEGSEPALEPVPAPDAPAPEDDVSEPTAPAPGLPTSDPPGSSFGRTSELPPALPPESSFESTPESTSESIVPPKKLSYVLFSVLAALSAIADLASKAWAQSRLMGFDPSIKGPKRITVIDGCFDFVYAQNPGGAWSMLRGLPEIVRRPFFLFVSAVAIVFIISIYARVDVRQRALRWGLPLALGGAIGNLVDRMRFGYVVDFIHFWVKYDGGEYHWPTFNVADVAIVVGVALMAVDLMFAKRPEDDDGSKAADAGDATPDAAEDSSSTTTDEPPADAQEQ